MSRTEEPAASEHRTKRVVWLPCGHQVYVHRDASLLAVSGPVLDHQSTCRSPLSSPPPDWIPVDATPNAEPLDRHHALLWGVYA
jgi:hypothetical protein